MRKILPVCMLFACAAPAVNAQSTAIRLILGEGHKVYTKPAFGNYCAGLGVDRTFNDHLTIGLDVAMDLTNALSALPKTVLATQGTTQTEYQVAPKLLSLNYHTEYALGGNEGTHVYIGTLIGLRHLAQQWVSEDYSANYSFSEAPVDLHVSKWLVPVGLRMGVRGAADSGFMDLYVAAGYQIGGGKNITGIDKLNGAAYAGTSALAFTLGWAYGIGW